MIGDPESTQVRELLRLVDRELRTLRDLLETGDPVPPALREALEIRQELLLRMAVAVVGETPAPSPRLARLISHAVTLSESDLELLVRLASRIEDTHHGLVLPG